MQSDVVELHEPIARFIFSADHFTATTGRVKSAAIAPLAHRVSGRLETSVYRVDGISESNIWAICTAHVDNPSAKRLMKARASCSAGVVVAQGLAVEADGQPHQRHANVIGWPGAKNERKILQQRIVSEMTLELRPEAQHKSENPIEPKSHDRNQTHS